MPTTNSSVLSLSQFSFTIDEPIIKVELDTTVNFNQYYTVGYVDYHYSIVARRALIAGHPISPNNLKTHIFPTRQNTLGILMNHLMVTQVDITSYRA